MFNHTLALLQIYTSTYNELDDLAEDHLNVMEYDLNLMNDYLKRMSDNPHGMELYLNVKVFPEK